jgi:hypothetical protein
MHHAIRAGSVEYVLVHVGDRLENVISLLPLSPSFSVYAPDDTPKQVNIPADTDEMTAKCLIDTTVGGIWPSNTYRLYLKLNAGAETPILGPVEFNVEEL